MIYDWSVTDEDHEAAIAVIKEVCREADAQSSQAAEKTHGRCKEISLCRSQRCIFRLSKEENVDMIKEASDRFGKEKIYAYLPTDAYLDHAKKDYEAAGGIRNA